MFNQQSNIGLFFFFFFTKVGQILSGSFCMDPEAQVEMLLFYLRDVGPRNNVCR